MIPNSLPKSLQDNPQLSRWIGFERAGRVRISTGKVELGQGIVTALVQIAADELGVDPDQIDIASGEAPAGPDENFTSGSNSVGASGGAIRLVCAEVRAIATDAAAGALGCAAAQLTIERGAVLHDGAGTGHDYWSLGLDLDRTATGSAPTRRGDEYRFVGRSLPRLDLAGKIAAPGFIHDIAPASVLHARVLHRPWPGARLAALDEAGIRRAAGGAVDIVREGDLAAFLSDDQVCAIRAQAHARQMAVWEGGRPPADDIDRPERLAAAAGVERNVAWSSAENPGGGQVVEAIFSRPCLVHGSIAPSCALATFQEGRLTVETHSQGVFVLRRWLSEALGLGIAAIDVIHRPGAGCYGHNPADDAAFEAAWLALRNEGRTVRVQWSREDELGAAPLGPAMTVGIRAELDGAGRPAHWTIDVRSPVQGRRPGMHGRPNFVAHEAIAGKDPDDAGLADIPDAGGGGATRNAEAYYNIPAHSMVHRVLTDLPLRSTTLRALGAHLNVFAIEGMIDDLAEIAGVDPLAYRLGLLRDDRARAVVSRAAALAGWPGKATGGGRALGLGFARYKNTAAYMAAVADVSVEEEVRVERVWCAVDAGLVINPDGAINQIEGGVVQAVSFTVKEQVRFAAGRIVSDTWETYPILRFSEVPAVETVLMEMPDEPPLGIGEVALGPTAAAVGNAVARALGARIRDLPLSRERIMATLLA